MPPTALSSSSAMPISWQETISFVAISAITTVILRARDVRRRRAPVQVVYPAGEAAVAVTLARLAASGPGELHLLVDFDRTITRHWADAAQTIPMLTSYAVLQQRWPVAERAQVDAISRHYYAIETNPHLSHEEKAPAMIEWHRLSNALAVRVGTTRADVAAAVASAGLALRPGVRELVAWCERHDVPLIVMSAGVADVVAEALRLLLGDQPTLPRVIHVVSNSMVWDAGGRLAGFSEPILHVFNKRAGAIPPDSAAAQAIRGRPHAILVGDSMGDATMADGDAPIAGGGPEESPPLVLKLGLLNHDVDALLPRFAALFDAVVTGDGGLEQPLLAWLRAIEAGTAAAAAGRRRGSAAGGWLGWLDIRVGAWADRFTSAATIRA